VEASLKRLRERRERSEEGGFTLIELLIVIVILGILAAIVVFAVQSLTGQSAQAACQSEFKTVETAMEAYKAQVGSYPTAYTQLQSSTTASINGGSVGPWLKDAVPTDTTDNSNYWFGIGSGTTDLGNVIVNAKTGTPSDGTNAACSNA
jgi:type II secretion system protein G